ncbi:MAG: PAS domain-containing protein [Magnetococcales bacterium]|nr:PAS domain-containing protein [Magnetococcales bacterium]
MSARFHSIGSIKLKMADIIFKEVLDVIVIISESGEVVDANPSFRKIVGYSREEVVGKPLFFIQKGDYESIVQKVMAADSSPMDYWTELITLTTKAGGLKKSRIKISKISDNHEGDTYYLCFFRIIPS